MPVELKSKEELTFLLCYKAGKMLKLLIVSFRNR